MRDELRLLGIPINRGKMDSNYVIEPRNMLSEPDPNSCLAGYRSSIENHQKTDHRKELVAEGRTNKIQTSSGLKH